MRYWDDESNEKCLEDICRVMEIMCETGCSRSVAVSIRAEESQCTQQTIHDALTRRIYGKGACVTAKFDEDARTGRIVETVTEKFGLTEHDRQNFVDALEVASRSRKM